MHNTHYIMDIVYDVIEYIKHKAHRSGIVCVSISLFLRCLPLSFIIHINYSKFRSSALIYIYILMSYLYIVYHTRHTGIYTICSAHFNSDDPLRRMHFLKKNLKKIFMQSLKYNNYIFAK